MYQRILVRIIPPYFLGFGALRQCGWCSWAFCRPTNLMHIWGINPFWTPLNMRDQISRFSAPLSDEQTDCLPFSRRSRKKTSTASKLLMGASTHDLHKIVNLFSMSREYTYMYKNCRLDLYKAPLKCATPTYANLLQKPFR